MKRIVATSDLHGHLPKIPDCDLVLVAGDICPIEHSHTPDDQAIYLEAEFGDWMDALNHREIEVAWVAGNHDFACQEPNFASTLGRRMPGHYLDDRTIEIDGVRIFGTPWVPRMPGWAFSGSDAEIQATYHSVRADVDIIVAHAPPYGILDELMGSGRHAGVVGIETELQRIRPRLMVFGHIHEAYGTKKINGIEYANVSHMNVNCLPLNPPVEFVWL